jgi:hypothetical protein
MSNDCTIYMSNENVKYCSPYDHAASVAEQEILRNQTFKPILHMKMWMIVTAHVIHP